VLFYPLYALLFADAGLSTTQITSLFVIWTVVSFLFEVPSGAWADTFSRRRLLAVGAVVRAAGFLLWFVWPTYAGFALGFACWAFCGATSSGTKEALLYDELAAVGATGRYTAITARSATAAMVAMLAATVLATPALAYGGFGLVTAGSVLVCFGSAAAALAMPERPRVRQAEEGDGVRAYVGNLRAGLAEVRRNPRVWRAVIVAAAVPGLSALDEYVSLLVHDLGVSVVGVPLALTVMVAAMAAGSLTAERRATASPLRVGVAVGVAGVALAAGSLSGSLLGLLPIAACYGLLQLAYVLTGARLQDTMSGEARATVLSVAGFGMDVAALGIYVTFGIGSLWLGVATLSALFAVPIIGFAVLTARWLPAHPAGARERGQRTTSAFT
jgi:MFS family permease